MLFILYRYIMMDKIREAIADKVLEISSSETYDIKEKLQKINRFRDLTEACQSFIKKYPEIEDELLGMIKNNDFDARVASSRIDTIIRLTEKNSIKQTVEDVKQDINKFEHIVEKLSDENGINSTTHDSVLKDETNEIESINADLNSNLKLEDNLLLESDKNENIQSQEKLLHEAEIDQEKESQYVDFEEVEDTDSQNSSTETNIDVDLPKEDTDTQKMSNSKKILYIVITIAAIVLIYYVILFIITNWKTILWVLIGCGGIAALVWYLIKRKK